MTLVSRIVWIVSKSADGVGIGEAASLVDHGRPNARLLFFGQREPPDGARGADLAAERAVVLAVADSGDENR